MFTGANYPIKDFLIWTRREIFFLVVVSAIPTLLFWLTGWKWIGLPWVPIAMLGTAVAFVVGFRNNASYARVWEARTAWGAVINASRAFGILTIDFVKSSEADRRELIYNHLAWLTALRFQLREPRTWETMSHPSNAEFRKKYYTVEEHDKKLLDELPKYLSENDFKYIAEKKNRATQILHLQSRKISELIDQQAIDLSTEIQLQSILTEFYRQQGVCERIKNFPYPRQFATLNLMFVIVFVCLVPLGMLQEFNKLGDYCFWLTIPVSVLIGWVFISLERGGDVTENPFEGSANDVPITQISRTIEIDLLDMLDEKELPPAIQPKNNIVM